MNRLTSLILTSITCYCLLPNNIVHVKANDGTEAIINKSVDEDIKTFNFDVNRYKIDSKLVYRPILITYIESKSSKFYDLVYFYDPNDEFDLQKANVTIEGKENADSEIKYTYTSIYNLTYAGMSKDKTIKRYFLNTYNVDKLNYKYREYSINTCSTDSYTYTLDNHFLFNQLGELEYNNCVNIRLEDAHAWSWHFDEELYAPDLWEKIKNYFGQIKHDTLKDQLFYSFYILNDWNLKEIKSMDIEYKKVLLKGFRHNVADTTGKSEMYNPDVIDDYSPKYYKWNDNNSLDNYDTSILLGNKISEFGNSVDFTYKTINSEKVSSKGLRHNYTWNSIQDSNQFRTCFGVDSDIYKFANYFFNDSSKKYYIINYDTFFYSYYNASIPYKNRDYNVIEKNKNFSNYLLDNGIFPKTWIDSITGSNPQDISYTLDCYIFTQEYTFDISAKYITYEDYAGVEYTYPVSVASVNQEGSGGTSEKPFTWLDIIKIIFCVVFGLIALIFLWPLLLPIGKIIVYIISIPFKALYKVIKNRGKKNE